MNPIMNYFDLKTPFGLEVPLVRKRNTRTTTRNFTDKAEFVAYIDSIKPSKRVDTYLMIECSCGKIYEFKSNIEVPSSNLICVCKRELIMYGN